MISPHTPPGTPLVVICVDRYEIFARMIRPDARDYVQQCWDNPAWKPIPFTLGQRVVLSSVEPSNMTVSGYVCRIDGIQGCYALECFRVAELPKCLTDILLGAPLPEDA